MQGEMEEAQKIIQDLQESLAEYRSSCKVSESELDQLKQDVNFYRQESAIYENKNSKLTSKLSKLKKRNSSLVSEKQIREMIQMDSKESQVEEIELLGEPQLDELAKKEAELTQANL